MLKRFAEIILIFFVPYLAYGKIPAPPTLNDLANADICVGYTNEVANYIQSVSTDETFLIDWKNSMWFSWFGLKEHAHSCLSKMDESCTNGHCTVHYSGVDTGCCVAPLVSGHPKEVILAQVNKVYTAALQHKKEITSSTQRFHLYGPKGICVATNQYQGCEVDITDGAGKTK